MPWNNTLVHQGKESVPAFPVTEREVKRVRMIVCVKSRQSILVMLS